nr:MAG TPA: hypothetical protein [Caudoviricetes sp.]
MIEIVRIEKLYFPVQGYNYNAQIWRSIDGKKFYYCGFGKYFHTLSEAESYKKEIEEGIEGESIQHETREEILSND